MASSRGRSEAGLWGIEHRQIVCEGGPFDGQQRDGVGLLELPLSTGARVAWEHEGQWAYYYVTDRLAPLPRKPQSRDDLWRMGDCLVAAFQGFEPITDEQRAEIERLRP